MKQKFLAAALACAMLFTLLPAAEVVAGAEVPNKQLSAENNTGEPSTEPTQPPLAFAGNCFYANGTPIVVKAGTSSGIVVSYQMNGTNYDVPYGKDDAKIYGGNDGSSTLTGDTSITMEGGTVHSLFGGSKFNKENGCQIGTATILMQGGTATLIQATDNGSGMASFADCAKYTIDKSDISVSNGSVGIVVGGAYGYTYVKEALVTISGGDLNLNKVSPQQTGVLLAGTNGKVDNATLHVTGGTVKGVSSMQRTFVTGKLTYNIESGNVGDLYAGSFYPVDESSAAWPGWNNGNAINIGWVNYGQVLGSIEINLGAGATVKDIHPGYQYLLSERGKVSSQTGVTGSIPTGADNAASAKAPVTITLAKGYSGQPKCDILGTAVTTLHGNHKYSFTAKGSSGTLDTLDVALVEAITEPLATVEVKPGNAAEFSAIIEQKGSPAQGAGYELTEAAKQALGNPQGPVKILVETALQGANNVSDEEKAAIKNLGGTVAQYFNITLPVYVNDSAVQGALVTKLGTPLDFTIEIPPNMLKKGRSFQVVRVHNGVATKLDTAVTSLNGATLAAFSSGEFSTYALTYTDAPVSKPDQGTDSADGAPAKTAVVSLLDTTPKTGASWAMPALLLAACGLLGLGVTAARRKEH